jgi:hypothetical protein
MKELRKDLESKLQFIIVLALFFPSLMEALFDENSAHTLTLKWATVVIFLILNYLYLNILKPDLTKKMIKVIDLFYDLNIFFFIPLICAFTPLVTNSSNVLTAKIVTYMGIYGTMLVPILTLILLGGCTIYISFPKFFNRIKG